MWKFQDFCITQILREINFVDSRSAKTAIFCHFWALEFSSFGKFQPLNVEKTSILNSEPLIVLEWQISHF